MKEELEEKKNKRKGIIGTLLFHLAILVLFAIYGLTTPVPIPQQGILINFGTSDVGSGDTQPVENTEVEEVVQEQIKEVVEPIEVVEEVTTQETIETIEVPKEEVVEEKPEPAEEKELEPVLDERLKQTLSNNPFNRETNNSSSEGDDSQSGDKGQIDGTPDGKSYTGSGSGNGNSYSLGGREALKKVKPVYNCQESGRVVISVKVDRYGNTLTANLDMKGTTNTASCLVKRAKEAALKTKWQSKPDAPAEQFGKITYLFELN